MTWQLFQHYLFSKRAGSFIKTMGWLCILGVGLGIASLITVTSVMNGFNNNMRDQLLQTEPHVIVTGKNLNMDEIKKKIKPLVDNDMIFPFEQQDIIIRTIDGKLGGAVAKGMDYSAISQFLRQILKVDKGPYASLLIENWTSGDVLIGWKLAQQLGLMEGDPIVLLPPEILILPKSQIPTLESLVIGGILSTYNESFDKQVLIYNKNLSLRPFSKATSLEKGLEIWLKDPGQASRAKGLLSGVGEINTWEDRNQALLIALRLEKFAISTLLSLGSLITSFSIISLLILLLIQKKADIGLLMAMGLSRRQTQLVFMKIGMLLSMMGIGSGMIVGLIISAFFSWTSFEILPSDIYYESSIPAQIKIPSLLVILSGSTLVAFFASWLPVRFHIGKHISTILRE